ncbi:MAG: hypothetical protein EPN85_03310 [Bacteroidetes bacterium]|nr:MAG: hypothetical protein EPN85_03310 [Bacteroidota bacterium]
MKANTHTIFLFAFFIGVLFSCIGTQNATAVKNNSSDTSIVTTLYNSKCKIFYSNYHDTLFQYEDYQRWNPSAREVLKADSIAMKCILRSDKVTDHLKEKLGSSYYLRQYVGVIDTVGNKLLFINYICEKLNESKGFDKNLVGLDDAFDCSFDLLFDMKLMQCKKIDLITK